MPDTIGVRSAEIMDEVVQRGSKYATVLKRDALRYYQLLRLYREQLDIFTDADFEALASYWARYDIRDDRLPELVTNAIEHLTATGRGALAAKLEFALTEPAEYFALLDEIERRIWRLQGDTPDLNAVSPLDRCHLCSLPLEPWTNDGLSPAYAGAVAPQRRYCSDACKRRAQYLRGKRRKQTLADYATTASGNG